MQTKPPHYVIQESKQSSTSKIVNTFTIRIQPNQFQTHPLHISRKQFSTSVDSARHSPATTLGAPNHKSASPSMQSAELCTLSHSPSHNYTPRSSPPRASSRINKNIGCKADNEGEGNGPEWREGLLGLRGGGGGGWRKKKRLY